jgi:hypothetical protein
LKNDLLAELQAGDRIRESQDLDYARTGFHHGHRADAGAMPAVAEVFRKNGYYLEMLTCLDRRHVHEGMRLVYTFNRFELVDRHRLHVDLAATRPWSGPPLKGEPVADAPQLPGEGVSIAAVFPAADWFEREIFDMYGVSFTGHPDLKRILLPVDSDFHALLKDFGRMDDASSPEEE